MYARGTARTETLAGNCRRHTWTVVKYLILLAGIISLASSALSQFGRMWDALDWSNEHAETVEAWQSGRLLLQTTERVRKMARMIGTARTGSNNNNNDDDAASAVISLPGQLDAMALSVGDYVSHYHLETPTSEQSAKWSGFAAECWNWRTNLTQAARQAYELQLHIRTFALRGVTVLQLLHQSWETVSRAETHLEMDKLHHTLQTLGQAVQQVDQRMVAEQEAGSRLIAYAVGQVQLSELEIAHRAQTWSWPTTLVVYGIALFVGQAAGLPVVAPAIATGIAHFVETRKNDQFKRQLLTQTNLYTAAGAVLTDARTTLMSMDKELLALGHDLAACEQALGWVSLESRREETSKEQLRVALLAALKDMQSLHTKADKAVSAYTGQSVSHLKQLAGPG